MKILLGILIFSLIGYAGSSSIRDGCQQILEKELSEGKIKPDAVADARIKFAFFSAMGLGGGVVLGAAVGLIVSVMSGLSGRAKP